jgi:opacity protein-like surface antigen
MKRWAWLAGIILLFSVATSAQEENPKAEVFAGYTYIRLNSGFGIPGVNMNGGSASVSFNPTSSIGIVADFGGSHIAKVGSLSVDANMYSYLFGPKLAHRSGRWTPFVQALFGGAHVSGSATVPSVAVIGFGSQNAFAMAVGGGVDWNATNHIGVRLIQAEYLMTRFGVVDSTDTQNNVRISAGVVFRF